MANGCSAAPCAASLMQLAVGAWLLRRLASRLGCSKANGCSAALCAASPMGLAACVWLMPASPRGSDASWFGCLVVVRLRPRRSLPRSRCVPHVVLHWRGAVSPRLVLRPLRVRRLLGCAARRFAHRVGAARRRVCAACFTAGVLFCRGLCGRSCRPSVAGFRAPLKPQWCAPTRGVVRGPSCADESYARCAAAAGAASAAGRRCRSAGGVGAVAWAG
jgi:hypothetical protein